MNQHVDNRLKEVARTFQIHRLDRTTVFWIVVYMGLKIYRFLIKIQKMLTFKHSSYTNCLTCRVSILGLKNKLFSHLDFFAVLELDKRSYAVVSNFTLSNFNRQFIA